ncbi:MAG: mevalonate kinase [Myxococcales bacterium]|nr:mevalonate kinase [Myxococcales bacterium]
MTLPLYERAEACGKVILVGEHAVVHGQPALAAGLPGGLTLTASPRPGAPISLQIPAWDIDLQLTADNEHPVARACLEVLGYCDGPVTGWTILGDTGLPCQAGCGSSAALSVALARLALGPDAPQDEIVEASLAGERVFHDNPSGIDNLVAASGGLVKFIRGAPPESIHFKGSVPLVVIPSGIPRSTGAQVRKVREFLTELPSVVRPLLGVIGNATLAAIEAIESRNLKSLAAIFNLSHELLSALGVSTPALDRLRDSVLELGARGVKLTGAGGGGCLLALPPDDPRPLIAALAERGHAPFAVTLRGS